MLADPDRIEAQSVPGELKVVPSARRVSEIVPLGRTEQKIISGLAFQASIAAMPVRQADNIRHREPMDRNEPPADMRSRAFKGCLPSSPHQTAIHHVDPK